MILKSKSAAVPPRQNVTSFLVALQHSGVSDSVTRLELAKIYHSSAGLWSDPPVLATGDLPFSVALRNLRRIDLDLGWNVGLTDSDLLMPVSAWS